MLLATGQALMMLSITGGGLFFGFCLINGVPAKLKYAAAYKSGHGAHVYRGDPDQVPLGLSENFVDMLRRLNTEMQEEKDAEEPPVQAGTRMAAGAEGSGYFQRLRAHAAEAEVASGSRGEGQEAQDRPRTGSARMAEQATVASAGGLLEVLEYPRHVAVALAVSRALARGSEVHAGDSA